MTTAIDVLTRALEGDPGARSFLEQTCNIYVLDVARAPKPMILGCWSFLQEGLNELDREESSRGGGGDGCGDGAPLMAPAKLLAEMGLRVARRSNADDRALVRTCLENAGRTELTTNLVQSNLELRERVVTRMAALAFDGNTSHDDNSLTHPIVREAFASAIAANAVSNFQIEAFAGWIASNSRSLPPFAVACVLFHVSLEVALSTNNDSTVDILQRLSVRMMAELQGPILKDAVRILQQQEAGKRDDQDASFAQQGLASNGRTAAKVVEAMRAWCSVTGLSFAGARHILNKVDINMTELLSSAMTLDSPNVLDALADWLEDAVAPDSDPVPSASSTSSEQLDDDERHGYASPLSSPPPPQLPLVSPLCMKQMRYIMHVDEIAFRSITEEQLNVIECKELGNIISELVDAVALQRFRFARLMKERLYENKDASRICLALARIAVALCIGYRRVRTSKPWSASLPGVSFQLMIPSVGILDLLFKCASHPMISICASVLPVVTPLLASETGLATQWLPTLQRLAIIPHHEDVIPAPIKGEGGDDSDEDDDDEDNSSVPCLVAVDLCGASYDEYILFRDTVLASALNAAFEGNGGYFMTSCTAAVEEFCAGESSIKQTAFHLEAALFCLSVGADQVALQWSNCETISSPPACNATTQQCMEKCARALSVKPISLTSNPLTLLMACRFVKKYFGWFVADNPRGMHDIAVDLVLSVLLLCATDYPAEPLSLHIYHECGILPYSEAARLLSKFLKHDPQHFLTNNAIAALGAGWEASFAAGNRSESRLSIEDRRELAIGMCCVLAFLKPEWQQQTSVMALALPSLCCLDRMLGHTATASSKEELDVLLDRIADELLLVTTINTAFCEEATAVNQRAWPNLNAIASKHSDHKVREIQWKGTVITVKHPLNSPLFHSLS